MVQAGLYRLRDDSTPLDSASVKFVHLGGDVQGKIEWQPLRALRELIREQQPDLIHANGFHALKYASLLAKVGFVRQPIVYRNISVASGWAHKRFKRAWGSWLCKSLTCVSSVSRKSAEDFARFYNIPEGRITVIHRGIDVCETVSHRKMRAEILSTLYGNPASRSRSQESESSQLLCHVGGFTAEKNHLGLLEAFRRIQTFRTRYEACAIW